jgi:hypothetical protein
MSVTATSTVSGSVVGAMAGIPPILAAAGVEVMLGDRMPQPAVTAMSSSAGLVVGAWMLSRSQQRDARQERGLQAAARPGNRTGPGRTAEAAAVRPRTPAMSNVTRTLLVVIAGFSIMLLSLLASLTAYGTLSYTSPDVVYNSVLSPEGADTAFELAAPRALVLGFVVLIPVAVWFAHRLRSAARVGLYVAIAMDALGTFAIDLHMERQLGRDWVTGQDMRWLLLGTVVSILACKIGRWLAARSQHRFDATQAPRLDVA